MDAPPGVAPAPASPDERAPAGVPPVVAVVVTSDPGPWLEEALAALGAQDYPDLSVLVIDAGSAVDPTPRVAEVLPSAYVRRLAANAGYGPSANDVLQVVEGASHFVFLHDDAAPDPDAVRLMVEEAYRSNAGVVAPKLVDWDDPRLVLAVGAGVDKTGVVHQYGRGELDQEQHDAVRDVFLAPGGCMLVRTDLFTTLGGFDAGLPLFGEDLDLCWRAHVVGARVVVAPAARVRHREAAASGQRPLAAAWAQGADDDVERLTLRHRVRTVVKAYGLVHLAVVLPQLVAGMLGTAALARLSGRRRHAGALTDALRWNLRGRADLRAARRVVQGQRALGDLEVRRLQSRSTGRVATAVRAALGSEPRASGMASAGRRMAGSMTGEGALQRLLIALGLATVLVVGSRHLLAGRLPSVGQLVPFPDSPATFLGLFGSGWRSSGLGSEAPAPFAFALLGVGGVLLAGAMDLLQKVVVLGTIPLGVVGAHRLAAPIGSWRGRALAAVLYAAVPLPYDALARGRWAGLVAYGVAPWVLARLLRATGLEPFGAPARPELLYRRRREDRRPRAEDHRQAVDDLLGAEAGTLDAIGSEELRVAAAVVGGRRDDGEARPERRGRVVVAPAVLPDRPPGPLWRQALAAAVLVALAAAFAPGVVAAAVLTGLALVLGGVLAGEVRAMARALAVAAGAAAGAGVLLAPWTLELVLPGAGWAGLTGLGRPASDAPGLAEILRFGTGAVGASPLNWGLLLVASLPLAVGRRWRFGWASRLWVVAVVLWGVAWAGGRGWLGIPPPPPDVLLAPAAAAVVLCASLGQAAFERDLSRYRFGLRQLGFVVAALAAVSTTLPVVAAALDGRWNLPSRNLATLVSWMPERRSEGAFRVLWTGEPDRLPLDGWALDGGLAYGVSRGGPPDATVLWPASDSGATGLLADALSVARRGETTTLGHLVAPLGVRYLAVPTAGGPGAPARGSRSPGLLDLLASLRSQIDLKLVQTDPALVVYENVAWAPVVSVLSAEAAAASQGSGLEVARTTNLAGAPPALEERSATRHRGPVEPGQLFLSEAYSPRWRLAVGSEEVEPRKAFGWANAFPVDQGGRATLGYRTSPWRRLAIAVQLGLWAAAGLMVARGRKAAAPAPAAAPAVPRPVAPAPATAGGRGRA